MSGPVTLWRLYPDGPYEECEVDETRAHGAKYRALPADEFDAMVAYAETGEAVEGVLIEANEDDGTMTPADVVRALVAERNAMIGAATERRHRLGRLLGYLASLDLSEKVYEEIMAIIEPSVEPGNDRALRDEREGKGV